MSREEKARRVRSAILKLVKDQGHLSPNEIRIILALERIVARLSNDPMLDKHLILMMDFGLVTLI